MELETLRTIAAELEVKGFKRMEKGDLVYAILDADAIKSAQNAPERPAKKRGRPKKDGPKQTQKPSEQPEDIEAKTEERRKREEERRKREEEERRKREEEAKQNGGDAPAINTPKKKMVRSGDLIKKSYVLKNEDDINQMLEEFKKED